MFNARGGNWIGTIKWAAGWRRYVFFPGSDTYFDAGCLRDIASEIERLMAVRS